MKAKPVKNPKVKTDWSARDYELIAAQVDKYYQAAQGDDKVYLDECLICEAVGRYGSFWDCLKCPLGDGIDHEAPCTGHPTFIPIGARGWATPLQIVRRMDYLIAQLDINGIEFYDEEI